jgi:hypothetical protein
MAGNWKFNTYAELERAVIQERQHAMREGYRDNKCAFSRGTFLCTSNDRNGQVRPYPEAECITWNESMKQIRSLVEEVLRDYPEVDEIYIGGGFDGANSPRDYHEYGEYEPWVSNWQVTVWRRND